MDHAEFGKFIQETRKEAGLTQRELADKLHITDKAVSKWERAICYPDVTLLEPLAEALGVTPAELLACQRQTPEQPEAPGIQALLDISEESVRTQRRRTAWVGWVAAALAILLLAAGGLFYRYTASEVAEVRRTNVVMKDTDGEGAYLYVPDGLNHLIRLRCLDGVDYDTVQADGTVSYTLDCRWNRMTRRGTVSRCEADEGTLILGGMMDQVGSSIDAGSLLGWDCVWEEITDCYPDPELPGGWIWSYRYYYKGDGGDYYLFDDLPETDILAVESIRKRYLIDFDSDGVVELFVLTRYPEEPYQLYDLEEGEIVSRFVDTVPQEVLDWFNEP